MTSIQYGTTRIDFNIEYKKRKTISISVEPAEGIIVAAPEGMSEDDIKEIVKSRGAWIVQRLYEFRNIESKKVNREFVNGESFMYLGRNYSLEIHVDKTLKGHGYVKLYRGKFHVYVKEKTDEAVRSAMETWYRTKAEEQILRRIKYFQKFFTKKPSSIKIKEQKKRWASCTSKDELLFNWRCSMAKASVIDYIIVHEMCHMYYRNHSKDFWDMVASIMSDYEARKEWLRDYGIRMSL